jgi:hypothetical protein
LTRYMSYVEVGSGVDAPWIDRSVGRKLRPSDRNQLTQTVYTKN